MKSLRKEFLKKVWMDGKFIDWHKATIHGLTHALHYGSAIFEGMRCYDTPQGPAVFRMKDHYKRLLDGV
ncbi:TPA: branched chain amino acid aminotransferase, partial [Candidatus Micrarchaeota archaeon]|nr:branched chain amino acid aminotransferase [Candidatus Micrarchaeota archaeon]